MVLMRNYELRGNGPAGRALRPPGGGAGHPPENPHGAVPAGQNQGSEGVGVWKCEKHGTAHYSGLQTCGSVWSCPICAAKITERRRLEVQDAINQHRQAGGEVQLLTLTTPMAGAMISGSSSSGRRRRSGVLPRFHRPGRPGRNGRAGPNPGLRGDPRAQGHQQRLAPALPLPPVLPGQGRCRPAHGLAHAAVPALGCLLPAGRPGLSQLRPRH